MERQLIYFCWVYFLIFLVHFYPVSSSPFEYDLSPLGWAILYEQTITATYLIIWNPELLNHSCLNWSKRSIEEHCTPENVNCCVFSFLIFVYNLFLFKINLKLNVCVCILLSSLLQ